MFAIGVLVLLPSQTVFSPTANASQIPIEEKVQVIEEATTTPPVVTQVNPKNNCYLLLKHTFKNVPRMAELQKTATPAMGNVAVFNYHGIPHVAIVTGQGMGEFYIKEWNWEPGQETTRTVSFADPNLVGFVTLN